MIDLDAFIERIREASFESPKATSYTAWRDRIQRILNDLECQTREDMQRSY